MLANNSQHHSNKLNEPPRQQVACREQQQKQLLLPGGPPVCLRKLNSKIGPNKQANVVGLEQISLSASERSLFALRLSLLTLLFSLLLHPTHSISSQLSSPVVRLAEPALKQSLGGGGGSAGSISGGPPLGTRAESSSSFFADIEDLDDSSIRKKIGSKQRATSNNNNNNGNADEEDGSDFEQLIARIVDGPQVFSSSHIQLTEGLSGHGSTVAADANNRTTMRFFRHGKTFGSIVYTNRNEKQQRRRLINCHLVDLEKHASDVALFEAKYEIKTVDIGFNEMMSLLESCTNIARFKPLHPSPGLGGGGGGGSSALRPLLVVSRPPPVPLALTQLVKLPAATSKANLGGSYNQQQQQQQTMTTTDKRRFRRQSKTLPPSRLPPLAPKQGLLQALAQVSREAHAAANRHLVLGEVTTPPAQRANPNKGGLGKALAEISNYDTTDLLAIWRGILPGTNWCGMGDRATSYNDLGFESDIDICCRAHDFCPVRLSAFSAGYGLFNWSFYTRSHCRCDQNFLNCLEQAQSPLSALVLKFYFNIMKTTCLNDNNTRLDPPATTTTTATAYSTSTTKQQQRPQQVAGTSAIKQVTRLANVEPDAEQQRALLDQIKAHLAIPASRRSQPLQTKLESKLQQQQQQQQQ